MPPSSGSVDVYLRISQDRVGQGDAHRRQRPECLALARSLGLKVRKVWTDTESATDPLKVRPGFEGLLASQPEAVIIWHEDRLIRRMRDLERVIELGVNVYPVKSGRLDLSTPTGRAVARMVTAMSQYEGEHKSERQRAANVQRAEAGAPWRGGRRAFGYLLDYSDVIPAESELVRSAFEEVLGGTSLRTITRRWNAAGIVTTRGNPWTTAGLRVVLRNPTYAGRRRLNGVEVADLKGVPPIVDRDTFAAVQSILDDPARLKSDRGGRGPLYLLSGVATCGICGAKLHGGKGTGRGRSWRVWRCAEGLHLARKAEPIEEYVTKVVIKRLRRKDAAKLLQPTAPDLGPLHARADGLRRQREVLAKDLDVDLDFAKARDRRLREELEQITAEITSRSGRSALAPFATGADPAEVWADLDIDARREAVRELVEVVVLPVGRSKARGFDPTSVRVAPRRP